MSEISEAQKRNEDEVRKIMESRGYNTKAYYKQQRRANRDFSIIPKIIVIIILIVAGAFGGKLLIDNVLPQQIKPLEDNNSYEELAQKFKNCLDTINTESLTPEDENFSTSLSEHYKQQINCYETYPEVSDSAEKTALKLQLSELETISQSSLTDAERQKRYAEIDAEYQQSIAQANKKYADAMAKLDAERAAGDAKYQERLTNYNKEKAKQDTEYAKQQAEREAISKARQEAEAERAATKQAACENYKAQFGEKTATELAESDAEVISAEFAWNQALKKVRSCTSFIIQSQKDSCNSHRNQEQQTANSYESAYRSLLYQKISYYNNLKTTACGY